MMLSAIEREFINRYQGNFPLEERPFSTIASRLNCSEDALIETVTRLTANRLLTRFGPLYDAARLGGGLTLAAMCVPQDSYESVTQQVNAYAEVAHNYRRNHKLNMWFVLATETPQQIDSVLHAIEQDTGLSVYNFPKQREFYIGLWLNISAGGKTTTVPVPAQTISPAASIMVPDAADRQLITATQHGLPVTHTPYLDIARATGLAQHEVLQRLQGMLSSGIIRRIGAVPNHYRLGLTANGMTVWDVDDSKAIELGNRIGQLDFVSHCYQRPRHLPTWRYNLFAMVHGADNDEVNTKVAQIENLLGDDCRAHETLLSSAILKKTGLRLAA